MKPNIIIMLLIMSGLSFGIQSNAHATSVNNINDAYQQYSAIDMALTNDDAASAKEAAGQLIAALKGIKDADAAIKAATGIN